MIYIGHWFLFLILWANTNNLLTAITYYGQVDKNKDDRWSGIPDEPVPDEPAPDEDGIS